MNKYCYSASMNAFYPFAMRSDYEIAGSWPADGMIVSDEIASEFMKEAPVGQMRVAGEDGFPEWGNKPEPTREEQIAMADLQQQNLLSLANEFMNSKQWPGKAAIGRLKGDELLQYNLWLDYLDSVAAIDANDAPEISWPIAPRANI
ncbi:TPA: tail fiber assembly protein [Citrobacter sedlakii]|uniref:tail fiber assembly protein n=1 Tax=Citrobacter sedlakii TaxID=67826 RepID=UPI003314564F